jgi:methylmalonyl-CoA mutase, N-terminal domain
MLWHNGPMTKPLTPQEHPGEYPFTRGIHPKMYQQRPWTMRQYAGFGSAAASNERYRYLLAQGTTGLSVAFDLPTQLGLDPDHPLCRGEVGRVGVSIASLADMRVLLHGLPLDSITTSMTINAPAMMLLSLYALVAQENEVDLSSIGGTVQNDILKEYIARGTYIYPPKESMRLVTDVFEYCTKYITKWNTISISGYHIREAGATAAQEIGFTIANAKAYVRSALSRGLSIDDFAPRLSFFFASHSNILEEAAKFRAARRLWAKIMREEFLATNPKSWMMRFHTQTGGSTLTAQQPEVNTVRTAYQALAAVLGGTQSLHTNAFDEALGLPTTDSARLALRTQQVLAFESGVTDEPDPLAGSYYIEALTDRLEQEAKTYIDTVEALGGSVAAIEAGYMQREIEEAAYSFQRDIEQEKRVIVGVNRFQGQSQRVPIQEIDASVDASRSLEVQNWRSTQDQGRVQRAIEELRETVRGEDNIFPLVMQGFAAGATLGEVCGVLRQEWGEFEHVS